MSTWVIEGWWKPARLSGKAHRFTVINESVLYEGKPGSRWRSFCGAVSGFVAEPREVVNADDEPDQQCAKCNAANGPQFVKLLRLKHAPEHTPDGP